MQNESGKIMIRRFIDRLTESGLLILTVALGVGAFAAGGALFINVQQQSIEMLNSPAYQEIVVSTRTDTENMENPVESKPLTENTILTQSDLSAAELIPSIEYSYIFNNYRLHPINDDSIAKGEEMAERKAQILADADTSEQASEPEESSQGEFGSEYTEDWDSLQHEDGIIISEEDEISGYVITSEFFSSVDLTVVSGSLFSSGDYTDTSSVVIIGNTLAETLVEDGEELSSLIGQRLLTKEGYQMIVGILESTDSSTYDSHFFIPYRDSANSAGLEGIKRMSMNSELRFSVTDIEELDTVATMLDDWFTSQFGEDQVNVSNPRIEAEQTIARNNGISLLLLILSIAGLFIASVNVAHMMLSRTMRMKKHVGILMALGATRKNINRLFASESLVVITIGSLAGVLIAVPLNIQMKSTLELQGNPIWLVVLSAIVSALIIFTFTQIPIRRFDSIKPADAMRSN